MIAALLCLSAMPISQANDKIEVIYQRLLQQDAALLNKSGLG
ncbi:hypothetical protein [Pectobacterium sp. B2J-2]